MLDVLRLKVLIKDRHTMAHQYHWEKEGFTIMGGYKYVPKADAEKALDHLHARLEQSGDKLARARRMYSELKREEINNGILRSKLKEEIDQLVSSLHTANETIQHLRTKLSEKAEPLGELTNAVDEINSGIGALKRQIDKAAKPTEALQRDLRITERKLQDFKDRVFPVTATNSLRREELHGFLPIAVQKQHFKEALAELLGQYLLKHSLIEWNESFTIAGDWHIRGDVSVLLPSYAKDKDVIKVRTFDVSSLGMNSGGKE